MALTPGHPAKPWWRDASQGERIYNLPPFLAELTVPPHAHGFNMRGLGASGPLIGKDTGTPAWVMQADAQRGATTQAGLLLELNNLVHEPLASAADSMPDVARYARDAYGGLAQTLSQLFAAEASIERAISTMNLPPSQGVIDEIRHQIEQLTPTVEAFKQRVNVALRGGIEAGSTRTALYAVGIGAVAVGLGWYVFSHKRAGRRKK